METVAINPAQIAEIIEAIQTATSVVVAACAAVCFWLGMNSWESVAK
jgi:hypothetical protein